MLQEICRVGGLTNRYRILFIKP